MANTDIIRATLEDGLPSCDQHTEARAVDKAYASSIHRHVRDRRGRKCLAKAPRELHRIRAADKIASERDGQRVSRRGEGRVHGVGLIRSML